MKVEDVDTIIQTLETYGSSFWSCEESNAPWVIMEIIEILNNNGLDLELTTITGGKSHGIHSN